MSQRRVLALDASSSSSAKHAPPRLRLRYVLLPLLLFAVGSVCYPRARAAWRLHDLATEFANYGLCMVGPMGPGKLLRAREEFAALVRQRLLTAGPDERPFEACAPMATHLAGHEVGRLHALRAADFVEYGSLAGSAASLAQLSISRVALEQLASQAFPFERNSLEKLVAPSSHAKEAAHPVAFERPLIGSGLPGARAAYHVVWKHGERLLLASGHSANLQLFESTDAGLNWRQTSAAQPGVEAHAGRCMAPGQPRAFVLETERDAIVVTSLAGDEAVHRTQLSGLSGVVNASCDATSALIAGPRSDGEVALFLCRHAGRCAEIEVEPGLLSGEFDIARVAGVIVMASAHRGVVRVRTSRDDGASFAPATVAFDAQSQPSPKHLVPSRLLVMGQRLMLYAAAKPGDRYPVLISDDFGASFRAPRASATAAARQTTEVAPRAMRVHAAN
jgi:hypothetical protein